MRLFRKIYPWISVTKSQWEPWFNDEIKHCFIIYFDWESLCLYYYVLCFVVSKTINIFYFESVNIFGLIFCHLSWHINESVTFLRLEKNNKQFIILNGRKFKYLNHLKNFISLLDRGCVRCCWCYKSQGSWWEIWSERIPYCQVLQVSISVTFTKKLSQNYGKNIW